MDREDLSVNKSIGEIITGLTSMPAAQFFKTGELAPYPWVL